MSVVLTGVALSLVLAAPCQADSRTKASATTIEYKVRAGDTLLKICSAHRDRTNHYSLADLLGDVRRSNQLDSNFLGIGQILMIPVKSDRPCPKVSKRVKDGAEVRGIYLTGPACAVSSVLDRVDGFVEGGGNTVVFDAKDIDGGVSFLSRHPLATWGENRQGPMISSLDDMLRRFHRRQIYIVARIALFLDGGLGVSRPDLALQDSTGNPWSERGCIWVDPASDEVRQYNLGLAAELARAGVDEIQFDYVRYPTNGWYGDWTGDLVTTADKRRQVISSFLAAARDTLAPLGVKISADLYGIMAWGHMDDLALTGQDVRTIASLVDVVCPMIYPSHFGPGFDGRPRPGDDPRYFIGEGTSRFQAMVDGQAEVRPWLQAFPYRVTHFNGSYIAAQVQAARQAGGQGWCLWNPACRYKVALEVLPGLCSEPEHQRGLLQPVLMADNLQPRPVSSRSGATAQAITGVLARAEEVSQHPTPQE